MKNRLRSIKSKLNGANFGIFLVEIKSSGSPIVYKMLFNEDIKTEVSKIIKNEIDKYVNIIEELDNDVPEYNPDQEQTIFKINVKNIEIFKEILPFLTEEKSPERLSKEDLNKRIKIRAWVVKAEFEENNSTKQIFFLQKFVKSQFLQIGKVFFIPVNGGEFKLLESNMLGMGDTFNVILIDDFFVSKNLKTFEYIFNFMEHYKKESRMFLKMLKDSQVFSIDKSGLDVLEKKINGSKRFAYKIYSAKVNAYYRNIDINKLETLSRQIHIGVMINQNKIIINENTDMSDLLKVLNDDYEQSLITDNKYISHKKKKL